mmetsp:Transcript_102614/g.294431  ORF Transcript_102614/g.294431 Transcript_102614/m.294431 type:complete len:205 (+) Transcript_102614:179-793(+)
MWEAVGVHAGLRAAQDWPRGGGRGPAAVDLRCAPRALGVGWESPSLHKCPEIGPRGPGLGRGRPCGHRPAEAHLRRRGDASGAGRAPRARGRAAAVEQDGRPPPGSALGSRGRGGWRLGGRRLRGLPRLLEAAAADGIVAVHCEEGLGLSDREQAREALEAGRGAPTGPRLRSGPLSPLPPPSPCREARSENVARVGDARAHDL